MRNLRTQSFCHLPNALTGLCLSLFAVGDNIRKGAALNAVQIVEKAIEMALL